MKDLAKNFGQRIKEYRKSRNLKQSELAEKIGADAKYLSRLETGLSTPSFKMIEKLADIFNIEVSSLFDFEQYNSKDDIINKLQLKIKSYSISQLDILFKFSQFIDKNCI